MKDSDFQNRYLTPLLMKAFGEGIYPESEKTWAQQTYNGRMYKISRDECIAKPTSTLHNRALDSKVMDFKRALDVMTDEERTAWYGRALSTLKSAQLDYARNEYLHEHGREILDLKEQRSCERNMLLAPIKIYAHFLRAVGDLSVITDSTLSLEKQKWLVETLKHPSSIIQPEALDAAIAHATEQGQGQAQHYLKARTGGLVENLATQEAFVQALAGNHRPRWRPRMEQEKPQPQDAAPTSLLQRIKDRAAKKGDGLPDLP